MIWWFKSQHGVSRCVRVPGAVTEDHRPGGWNVRNCPTTAPEAGSLCPAPGGPQPPWHSAAGPCVTPSASVFGWGPPGARCHHIGFPCVQGHSHIALGDVLMTCQQFYYAQRSFCHPGSRSQMPELGFSVSAGDTTQPLPALGLSPDPVSRWLCGLGKTTGCVVLQKLLNVHKPQEPV